MNQSQRAHRFPAQVCDNFVAPIPIRRLLIMQEEVRWVLLADKYRSYGLDKIKAKFVADLLPKLRHNISRFKADPAWSELTTSGHLHLLEAALNGGGYGGDAYGRGGSCFK